MNGDNFCFNSTQPIFRRKQYDLGWSQILLHLSHVWMLIVAIGYFCTAIGFQSRAFLLSGLIHLVGIAIHPYVIGWQFLFTGLVMGSNLLAFS